MTKLSLTLIRHYFPNPLYAKIEQLGAHPPWRLSSYLSMGTGGIPKRLTDFSDTDVYNLTEEFLTAQINGQNSS